MNLIDHLKRQITFGKETFGESYRHKAIINHIKKELNEIEDDPNDLEEWIDVILLAFDGAWRSGHNLFRIVTALNTKLEKNINRKWPDDHPIEHIK